MMRDLQLSVILVSVVTLDADPIGARTWTDKSGKHSVDAVLVECKVGMVSLKKTNGDLISIALEQLSTADRKFASLAAQSEHLHQEALKLEKQDKVAEALLVVRQMLEIDRQMYGDFHESIVFSLQWIANLHEWLEQFSQARAARQQALEVQTRLLGPDHWQVVDARLAVQHVQLLAGLSPKHRKTLARVSLQDYLVSQRVADGRYRQALQLAEQNLRIRQGILGEDHLRTAMTRSYIAAAHRGMGNYAHAEPMYRAALRTQEKQLGKNHPSYAMTLNNLARLYTAAGDFARAEPTYQQSLRIHRQVLGSEHADTATVLNNLAALYQRMGRHAAAEEHCAKSLTIRRKLLGDEHAATACTLNNLALIRRSLGKHKSAQHLASEAHRCYQKWFGDQHPRTATCLSTLAQLDESLDDLDQAEKRFQRVIQHLRQAYQRVHPDIAIAETNLARLYLSQNKLAHAEPLLRSALAVSVQHLELAASGQSQRQQLAMAQSLRHVLDCYLELAIRSGRYDQAAYRQVLAWKGRVLSRQQAIRAVANQPELAPTDAQLRSVTRSLSRLSSARPSPSKRAAWQHQLEELSAKKEQLEGELARKSAAYRAARRPVSLEDIRQSLPPDGALVDFLEYQSDGQRRLAAFVVRESQPIKLIEMGDVETLSQSIDQWRQGHGCGESARQAGRHLRERIWNALHPHLKEASIILISPDGPLSRLPMGALPGEQPGTYLLEDQAIAILPAPRGLPHLAQRNQQKSVPGNVLVLGGVDYDCQPVTDQSNQLKDFRLLALRGAERHRFDSLAGTRSEMTMITGLYHECFGYGKITTLAASQASEDAVRRHAPRHLYLHFATHGYFAPPEMRSALDRESAVEHPLGLAWDGKRHLAGYHPGLLSGLALAGANQTNADLDDGILTSEEVETLDLTGANLAVLSACETGLGKAAGGEGLLGLQRAFQIAGAKTVIASLWKVDDLATRDLMSRFYDNLWNQEMGKLEALRQAQLEMLRGGARGNRQVRPIRDPQHTTGPGHQSPFYWAAFVLSGDWR